jgi:hypothetical protein
MTIVKFTTMIVKYLPVLILMAAANTSTAQTKKQQETVNRIVTDQKLWQQSKMPTLTIYKSNYFYQVPLFPGQYINPRAGLFPFENKMVPGKDKINYSLSFKYPTHYFNKSNSVESRKLSYVHFI